VAEGSEDSGRLIGGPRSSDASDVLEHVVSAHSADTISFGELMVALHERGFAFLMAIFVLPNCVPIPVPPGFSTLFSIPLLFLSVQMIYGVQAPWLPMWLRNKRIKRSTLAAIVEAIVPRLRRIEKIMRHRYFFFSTKTSERYVGFMCFLFSISIAIPLPMTNFPPGVGILLMSLGLLSRDGIVIALGTLVGTAGLMFTTAILVVGQKAALALIGMAHHAAP
jgi:hypothetical protein